MERSSPSHLSMGVAAGEEELGVVAEQLLVPFYNPGFKDSSFREPTDQGGDDDWYHIQPFDDDVHQSQDSYALSGLASNMDEDYAPWDEDVESSTSMHVASSSDVDQHVEGSVSAAVFEAWQSLEAPPATVDPFDTLFGFDPLDNMLNMKYDRPIPFPPQKSEQPRSPETG